MIRFVRRDTCDNPGAGSSIAMPLSEGSLGVVVPEVCGSVEPEGRGVSLLPVEVGIGVRLGEDGESSCSDLLEQAPRTTVAMTTATIKIRNLDCSINAPRFIELFSVCECRNHVSALNLPSRSSR